MQVTKKELKRFTNKTRPSVWRRIFAAILDWAVIDLTILTHFETKLLAVIPAEEVSVMLQNQAIMQEMASIGSTIILLVFAYFILFEYALQQTPGKMMLKLKVISTQKKNLSLGSIIVRNLMVIPYFPFFLLWIFDPAYLLYNNNGQRWTEKLSKTRVVREK